MSMVERCSRCSAMLKSYCGDHLCPECAEALGRNTTDPFWGGFASHPDSRRWPEDVPEDQLTRVEGDPLRRMG